MKSVVSSYTLTHAGEIMGNGHIRPRDVSGESCLTVTNTLVPCIFSLIYEVPRVFRLSPTDSFHIYRFQCIRCLVTTVCHQRIRVVSCVSCVLRLVSTVYPQHSRVVLSVSGSNSSNQTVLINSNQLQLISTVTPDTFIIASPPDSNEASPLTFL
jgi:hypothetical protein